MTLIVLGLLFIVSASLFIQFPELVKSLKTNDEIQWKLLGSPTIYGSSKMISVFSWVLNRGYEKSPSPEVVVLGQIAFKKALILKYTLMIGVVFILLGIALALFNQFY